MSTSKANIVAANRSFTCRNIKKDFTKFIPSQTLTKEFHLELGEKMETSIVDDRPTDWVELANRDVGQVGIANVIACIERQGLDIRQACRFQDSEAVDMSELNPLDTHAYENSIQKQKIAEEQLISAAAKLGVTFESLVQAALSGDVSKLVKVEKTEGGSDNA